VDLLALTEGDPLAAAASRWCWCSLPVRCWSASAWCAAASAVAESYDARSRWPVRRCGPLLPRTAHSFVPGRLRLSTVPSPTAFGRRWVRHHHARRPPCPCSLCVALIATLPLNTSQVGVALSSPAHGSAVRALDALIDHPAAVSPGGRRLPWFLAYGQRAGSAPLAAAGASPSSYGQCRGSSVGPAVVSLPYVGALRPAGACSRSARPGGRRAATLGQGPAAVFLRGSPFPRSVGGLAYGVDASTTPPRPRRVRFAVVVRLGGISPGKTPRRWTLFISQQRGRKPETRRAAYGQGGSFCSPCSALFVWFLFARSLSAEEEKEKGGPGWGGGSGD